jgi:hypothetical protein
MTPHPHQPHDPQSAHPTTRRSLLTSAAALLAAAAVPPSPASAQSEEATGLVKVANLVYARNKTSVCFASHFLGEVRRFSHIRTADGFAQVNLESDDLLRYPFAIMTGEGSFTLTDEQQKSLRRYLLGGGFLLASSGCSSDPWDSSFRRELSQIIPDHPLVPLAMDHPVFHTVHDIQQIKTKDPKVQPQLEALIIDDRIVLIYSRHGLNDTANAGSNCCCCGGNEILNARQINVNLLAYALTH